MSTINPHTDTLMQSAALPFKNQGSIVPIESSVMFLRKTDMAQVNRMKPLCDDTSRTFVTPAPQPFRFLDLAPELRDTIYRFHLLNRTGWVAPRPCVAPHRIDRRPLDIILVCRKIFHEAECIWYQHHRFALSDVSILLRFLQTLNDRRRAAIRSLAVYREFGFAFIPSMNRLWEYLARSEALRKVQYFELGIWGDVGCQHDAMSKMLARLPKHFRHASGGIRRSSELNYSPEPDVSSSKILVPWRENPEDEGLLARIHVHCCGAG